MTINSPVYEFLQVCADAMTERAAGPVQQHGVARFQAALTEIAHGERQSLDHERTSVPVEDCLVDLPDGEFTAAFERAAADIAWIPSHRMTDGGTEAALAPIDLQFDFDDLTVGMLLLGPRQRYPEHCHPPHELYLPISDGGEWRYGGEETYRPLPAEALAYNHPNDVHGVVAGDQPLAALFMLWPDESLGSRQA